MVLGGRIELPLLSEPEPKSGASTNFATRAKQSPQNLAQKSQTRLIGKNGVDEGVRTLDRRSHNPELYQLSYVHHIEKVPVGTL